jgi:NAD(P)-dependent dehydrogenase (short-subunit alcohol dehydrogenase family)
MTVNALAGKSIAITGGAQGIGAATAHRLAAAGARVVIGDLDTDLAKHTADTVDGLALPLDVSSRESVASFLDEAIEQYGALDGLVNNAGFMVIGRMLDVPLERQLRQVSVNLDGVINGCYEAATRLPHGGRIVNIASLAGRIPMPGSAVYNATKAGVLALTESLDAELSPRIRVSAVMPSFTNTHLIDGTKATGLMKPVEPEDVAAAVLAALLRPRLFRVVPKRFAWSAAHWSSMLSTAKPAMRRMFGMDTVFTEPDLTARSSYDERTGFSG